MGEGNAIDHLFSLTCTHTPHLRRHYRSACLMFLWGTEDISHCHFPSVGHQKALFVDAMWQKAEVISHRQFDCNVFTFLKNAMVMVHPLLTVETHWEQFPFPPKINRHMVVKAQKSKKYIESTVCVNVVFTGYLWLCTCDRLSKNPGFLHTTRLC